MLTIPFSGNKDSNRKITPYVVNLADASPELEYEIVFANEKPSKIELFYYHASLNNLAGFLRVYQKGCPEDSYKELINADSTPEPLPIPLDSAAGSNSYFFYDFCGYAMKVKFDCIATVGTFFLSLGTRP